MNESYESLNPSTVFYDFNQGGMPPPQTVPFQPSTQSGCNTTRRNSCTTSHTVSGLRGTSGGGTISRRQLQSQLKCKMSASGSDGHLDRWYMSVDTTTRGMTMGPKPVRTDGVFIICESSGGASSSIGGASSSSITTEVSEPKRHHPNHLPAALWGPSQPKVATP